MKALHFSFKCCGIEASVLGSQMFFVFGGHIRRKTSSLIGGLGFVVLSSHLAADSGFLQQFHYGLKEVAVEPQNVIEFIEDCHFFRCVMPHIPHRSSNNGIVLLFYEAIVILP